MDLLIVEPLEPDVVQWLEARYPVRLAPELAREPLGLRRALFQVRAMIIPPSVAVDEAALKAAPHLRAIGRLSAGVENIDLDACARANVEVVRPTHAAATAEAEFAIGALLQMLRRVPVVNAEGLLVGRELGGTRIGLVGMTPAAKPLATLLKAFGADVIGYDPGLHASDPLWAQWGVRPVPLRTLMEQSDGVCMLLAFFTRYRGLVGERYLGECKPNQVLVSLTHSSLFEESALAEALDSGRMAAAWLDSLEPGALDPGRPLHGAETLQVTPRVASTTRESRKRSAWSVARRIDEILADTNPMPVFRPTWEGDGADLADD
ncbi:MAG: phosphoglycerate dehydrogenase [Burkholderiaceae bacterium]|nr:phosphoglycerate dehydrogenase [Rhodoferax sp.]MCP5284150.1 phosphoglycerate dehydrogenase [Burkholderiaceae bacterium]